jgi:Co/Zn/Cd efflux system component
MDAKVPLQNGRQRHYTFIDPHQGSLRVRATAALVKAATLALMGLWVLGSTIWHAFVLGTPRAEVMGLIAFLALAVNTASVLILMKYKDSDANVRSVWLCSRNDAIGNVAVMLAALGVWGHRNWLA